MALLTESIVSSNLVEEVDELSDGRPEDRLNGSGEGAFIGTWAISLAILERAGLFGKPACRAMWEDLTKFSDISRNPWRAA